MVMVVGFSDGFTSASQPTVEGIQQVNYTIANNTSSATTLFTLDSDDYTTAFINFELERINNSFQYRQSGQLIMNYNGSVWVMSVGNYQGDDLILPTLEAIQNITLTVTTASGIGSIKYTSGNMSATGYSGNLKLYITKMAVA